MIPLFSIRCFDKRCSQLVRRFASTNNTGYHYIKTELKGSKKNVGLVKLDRPEAMNALSRALTIEMIDALKKFDQDKNVACMILTGSGKVFASGGDIKENVTKSLSEVYLTKFLTQWDEITTMTKPVIAAVNGLALGGGCQIALKCDIIYASAKALFGHPEILIGTFPGACGTQVLARELGKSRAMEIVLTGNPFTAQEAYNYGLISKVCPHDDLLEETVKLGEKIGENSKLIVTMAKSAINYAYDSTLKHGCQVERELNITTRATNDYKEGTRAFIEKRKPVFTDS